MVARPGQYQASLNSGELAPAVWGRSDLKQFYSGASLMAGAEPVPQGGWDNAPGSVMTGRVRGVLAAVATSVITSSPGPHSGVATVFDVSFAETALECVDVLGLTATLELGAILRIETSLDGVSWAPFGPALRAEPTARSRRVAVPPGDGVRATRARLRLYAAPPGAVTLGLAGFSCLAETSPLPAVARSFKHTFSAERAYTIDFTPGHADVWRGDFFVGCFAHSVTAAMLPTLGQGQRLNTMLLWHPDLPPQRVLRGATDDDWSCGNAPFENLPDVDYGGSYTKIDDVWDVYLSYTPTGPFPNGVGLTVSMLINGEETAGAFVASGPDYATFASDMQAAIEALPSVGSGVSFAFVAYSSTQAVFTLTFSGAANTGQVFTVVPRVVNSAEAAATAVHSQVGSPGGEPIMSVSRGYPSTAGFYQDRLYLGGFKAEGGAVLGSVTGEYYDLNTLVENAAGGLLFRLDTDGAETILHLAQSKHLLIFTDTAEYYVSDRALVRGMPPNIARSSRNGCAPGIRPVENDGGLLYFGRSRSIAFLASYSDVSQTYESVPISLLASHLVTGVKAADLQTASESTDASRYWIVRDDGLMVIGVLIRNQEVIAFVRWPTDGTVIDVCVDGANQAFALVRRRIGASFRIYRERLTTDALLHQQTRRVFGVPTTLITGLADYEGATVWALADGYADGPHVVSGGAITLGHAALDVLIGRWTAPIVDTLPLPRLVGERTQLARPARVHTVRATTAAATSLAIGANGRPARDVPLLRGGQVSDQPVQPYSGPVQAAGLFGWSEDGIVRFTQMRPGRFGVRNVTIEARV